MQPIAPRDAEALARTGAVLLDVRGRADYLRAHLPGARSAPVDGLDFDGEVQRMAPFRDQPVVVYCRDEDCLEGPRALQQLRALGYSSLYQLTGGSVAWWKSGRPMEGAQVEAHMPAMDDEAAHGSA